MLLWGERGCGKSSLVRAVFTKFYKEGLRIIEIGCEDLKYLGDIIDEIRKSEFKFIIFCDDLSFENGSNEYKISKAYHGWLYPKAAKKRPFVRYIKPQTSNKRV